MIEPTSLLPPVGLCIRLLRDAVLPQYNSTLSAKNTLLYLYLITIGAVNRVWIN